MKEEWSFILMTRPADWRLWQRRTAPRVSEVRFLCFCIRCELKP